jgi:hypothetical protein
MGDSLLILSSFRENADQFVFPAGIAPVKFVYHHFPIPPQKKFQKQQFGRESLVLQEELVLSRGIEVNCREKKYPSGTNTAPASLLLRFPTSLVKIQIWH